MDVHILSELLFHFLLNYYDVDVIINVDDQDLDVIINYFINICSWLDFG